MYVNAADELTSLVRMPFGGDDGWAWPFIGLGRAS